MVSVFGSQYGDEQGGGSFLAWVDFHTRSREEKWGTTRSLKFNRVLNIRIKKTPVPQLKHSVELVIKLLFDV